MSHLPSAGPRSAAGESLAAQGREFPADRGDIDTTATSSQPSRVTAVLVTHNSARTLPATLASLRAARAEGWLDCVVVDNDSHDDTVAWLQQHEPRVTLVRAPNLGFGAGCNRGLVHARTPYVLFLNPDAAIEAPALRVLVDFLESHPQAAIVGPAIRNTGFPDQREGWDPTPRRVVRAALGGLLPVQLPRTIHEGGEPFPAEWVCGAVLLARRSVLADLGGFDPRFFLYFEEADLCRRARALGHSVWAVGAAVADHVPATSAKSTGKPLFQGCVAEHYFASRYWYLRKHHGALLAAAAELADLALLWARNLARRAVGRPFTDEFVVRRRLRPLALPPRPAPNAIAQAARA